MAITCKLELVCNLTRYFFLNPGGHFGFLLETLTLYLPDTHVMVFLLDGEGAEEGTTVSVDSAFSPGTNCTGHFAPFGSTKHSSIGTSFG